MRQATKVAANQRFLLEENWNFKESNPKAKNNLHMLQNRPLRTPPIQSPK